MGKRAANIILETPRELKALLKKEKNKSLQHRLQAALLSVTDPSLTRNQIAVLVGVNKRTLERWFLNYKNGGMQSFLALKTKAPKKSKITPELHTALENKLKDKANTLRSYYEVQEWILTEHNSFINYQTLRSYMIRHFGKRLKVARRVIFIKDKHFKDSN